MQKERRDAFSVLLKSAAKRSSDPPLSSAKKAKANTPAPSKYAACPVCSCQIPTAFLAEHAAGCGVERREVGSTPAASAPKPVGPGDTPSESAAGPTHHVRGGSGQQTPEPARTGVLPATVATAEPLPGSEHARAHSTQPQATPGGSAFEHMLQRQKDLSRVFNSRHWCLFRRILFRPRILMLTACPSARR